MQQHDAGRSAKSNVAAVMLKNNPHVAGYAHSHMCQHTQHYVLHTDLRAILRKRHGAHAYRPAHRAMATSQYACRQGVTYISCATCCWGLISLPQTTGTTGVTGYYALRDSNHRVWPMRMVHYVCITLCMGHSA